MIIAALLGAFLILFSAKAIYGIAFITAFRTLFLLARLPMGNYGYSAEGFLTLAIIGVGLVYVLLHREAFKGVFIWPFVIFLVWCVLTLIVAEDTTNYAKKLARLIGYFFLYLTVFHLSQDRSNRKILTGAFIVSALITVIPTVYVYHLAPEEYMRLVYGVEEGLSEVGIMPKNNFGFYCCYMLLFLVHLYSIGNFKSSKVLVVAVLAILATGLVLSFTRTAWVGFVAALPVLILSCRHKARLLAPILAVLLIAVSLFPILRYGAYQDIFEKKEYGFSSFHFRVAYAWPASIKAFQEKPTMGWGLGNDLYAISHTTKLKYTSHSDYLLVLVETGIVGLFLYLCLLGALFWRTISSIGASPDERTRALCVSALAVFVAYLVGSSGEHLLQTPGATGQMITILAMAHGATRAAKGIKTSLVTVPKRLRCSTTSRGGNVLPI